MEVATVRRMKRVVWILLGTLGFVVGLAALVGSLRSTHVTTASGTTTASPEAIWELWANVEDRDRWDEGLEWARVDGEFALGATGEIKLNDLPVREFEVVSYTHEAAYTDRFFLPLGTHMDWRHTITELGDGQRQVTFDVETRGPNSLMIALIARSILEDELDTTVARLIELAESRTDR